MTTHASEEIGQDALGFSYGKCTCGWESSAAPNDEIAIDMLMEHAAFTATSEPDDAVMHLIAELRGQLETVEAERDRYKAKVAELTNKLAAGAMAVHSDPDPI